MTDITVRDYTDSDRSTVIQLARELQAAEISYYDRMSPADMIGEAYLNSLLADCDNRNGRIFLACDDGVPVGYAVILTCISSNEEDDEVDFTYAYLRDLMVTQARRGRGIGTALLRACEDFARRAGDRWLRLTMLEGNTQAARVYQRAGFKPLFIQMEKALVKG